MSAHSQQAPFCKVKAKGKGCNFHPSVCRLDGKHVVFGSVVEGMDVIKTVERYGSQSGSTSGKITVSDCGQL